jgi:hypothetical protein
MHNQWQKPNRVLCMGHRSSFVTRLFYDGPYHHIPLLEKNQYETIRPLRLIVYHHNLHLWYKVVYIGGIKWYRGIIGILSRWHKRNISFLHFNFFHFPLVIWSTFLKKNQTEIFILNFKNESFHFLSFQISKNKNFHIFSFQIFSAYFKIFHFPWWYGQKFSNFKIDFFVQFFPFPSGGMAQCFKIQKQKKSIQISKNNFFQFVFHFKFSLWHKYFFLDLRLTNLSKTVKIIYLLFIKKTIYCIGAP